MSKSENSMFSVFSKGILKENPVLRLVLGTCPTLAVTTSAINGIGMGLAATFVLVCSGAVVSLLRNVIPSRVRIPAFITIIAGFVTIVQMIMKAFLPSIDKALGIFLPLIVVNCIILARAEMFASKNPVIPSILDGLGMGLGFTATLTVMGIIREFLGAGSFFSLPVTSAFIDPMLLFILPPGGFFVFGCLVAASNAIAKKQGKNPVMSLGCGQGCSGCEGCPMAALETKGTEKALDEADNEVTKATEETDIKKADKPEKEKTEKPLKEKTEKIIKEKPKKDKPKKDKPKKEKIEKPVKEKPIKDKKLKAENNTDSEKTESEADNND